MHRWLGKILLWGMLGLGGCASEANQRPFLYPTPDQKIYKNICDEAFRRGYRRFTVVAGRLHTPHAYSETIEGLSHTLEDGIYHCGREGAPQLPCAPGTTQMLEGGRCSFQR